MQLSPDQLVLFQVGGVALNATVVYTWVVMALLVLAAHLATRTLSATPPLSRWQNLLEVIIEGVQGQIREVSGAKDASPFLPFVGTLFLFIAGGNLLTVLPDFLYKPPTGSLSTTAALAACVFVAVPLFGVQRKGLGGYLKSYVSPSFIMLPFNVIGELSRTLALAVRLFGNVMSGSLIGGVLLAIAPLLFPVLMQALGLLTGVIQAYIFAILAMVYLASALQEEERTPGPPGPS